MHNLAHGFIRTISSAAVVVCASIGAGLAAQPAASAPPPGAGAAGAAAGGSQGFGGAFAAYRDLFRPYEPNTLGLTWDEGDGRFMDFTLSVMFPLLHGFYPDRKTAGDDGGAAAARWPLPYFAANLRAGQYIGTRRSAPVVGKRFNPLLALRLWTGRAEKSAQKFVELVYAHESNGQWITTEAAFDDEFRARLNDERDPVNARLAARDSISRGWDYVGVQASWGNGRYSLRGRFNYYVSNGVFQGGAEEYYGWENDPDGAPRRYFDGVSVRGTATFGQKSIGTYFTWDNRYAVTVETGYSRPFERTTVRIEAGFRIVNLPFMVWHRQGYNSDLVDYYRRDQSTGVMVSFWDF